MMIKNKEFWLVYQLLRNEGSQFLYHVCSWAYGGDFEKIVGHYKGKFETCLANEVEDDVSVSKHDICLLYACFKAFCRAPVGDSNFVWNSQICHKLEEICTELKNLRCDLRQERKVNTNQKKDRFFLKITTLLKEGLQYAGEIFKHDVVDLIKKLEENVIHIQDQPLVVSEVDCFKSELFRLRENHRNAISSEICGLKKNYANLLSIVQESCPLEVDVPFFSAHEVFSCISVVKGEIGENTHSEVIKSEDILSVAAVEEKPLSFVIVEGESGAGKTTFCNLLMSRWASCEDPLLLIKGLKEYAIVLYFNFDGKAVSDLQDLLLLLLPVSSSFMKNKDFVSEILKLKILFIFDGLNEWNEDIESLLREITIEITENSRNLTVLLASRLEKKSVLKEFCNGLVHVYIKLTAIPFNIRKSQTANQSVLLEKRLEYIQKLHSDLVSKRLSKQDTDGLISFLKHIQIHENDYFQSHMILSLLVYMWACKPEQVNLATFPRKLFMVLHDLILPELTNTLRRCSSISLKDLEGKRQMFLRILYKVSLVTLSSECNYLSDEDIENLCQTCATIGLPVIEMCSALLDVKKTNNAVVDKLIFISPPRSMLEAYAAHHVYDCILHQDEKEDVEEELCKQSINCKKSLHGVKDALDKSQVSEERKAMKLCVEELFRIDRCSKHLSDYQGVLLNFVSLLAERKFDSLTSFASEIVDLFQSAKISNSCWLDVITEVKYHEEITKLIAANIHMRLIIRDGQVRAAREVFRYLDERLPLQISWNYEVLHIHILTSLLREIAQRNCDIELFLNLQWKDSKFGFSNDVLNLVINQRCRLSSFSGNLNDYSLLPDTIKKLRCTIARNEEASHICKSLQSLHSKLDLDYLGVHVVNGIKPELLSYLPIIRPLGKECATLWMSSITDKDVDWACRVARALLPEDSKYSNILFPRSDLSREKCHDLVSGLRERKVMVKERGAIKVSSSTITRSEEIELRFFTLDTLNCGFHCVGETDIWHTRVRSRTENNLTPTPGYLEVLIQTPHAASPFFAGLYYFVF